MTEPFYADGLKFSCQRCSSCCRFDPGMVYLSEKDIERLLVWSGLTREQFIDAYCRWVSQSDDFDYLCLLEKPGYDCILWDKGCIAYGARPFQCSSYPFWPSLLFDEDWWAANAQDCPGVNNGQLYNRIEIEEYLTRRRQEPYIRRKAQK